MNCNEAKRRLSAYLDRDLTFEEEERLKEHLVLCQECADEEEQLECLVDLLHGLPEVDPGEGFLAAVQARIAEAEAGGAAAYDDDLLPGLSDERPSWGDRIRAAWASMWLRPAMGVALGLVIGLMIGLGGSSDDGVTPAVRSWESPGLAQGGAAGEPSLFDSELAGDAERRAPDGYGPFDDIDLSHLDQAGDVDDEYILEPFVRDPLRGLVPAGSGTDLQRTVSGDRNAQSDVYIIF